MNVGLYQGAASLTALERMQSVISENIAAAAEPGYQKTDFSLDTAPGAKARPGSEQGGGKESTAAYPQLSTRVSRKPGELRGTGDEMDFAISGRGYFQVQRPDGSTGYTRDGEFHLSPDRTIVTKQGFPVLGDSGPLTLRPEGGHLSVNAEGQLIQGEVPVGKMTLMDFTDAQKLRHAGDGMVVAADGSAPQGVENPAIINGSLESSNVQSLQEMVNLIAVSRAYEASQKVITTHDDSQDKAIQILGNPSA